MKKSAVFVLILTVLLMSVTVFADNEKTVYVTISDGSLVLANAKIEVYDADNDGSITVNDALLAAHKAYCKEGLNGYVYAVTDYGISLYKLWNIDNNGGYGYYVNDKSPNSLLDKINDGDRIYAFVYTDTVYWTDSYSFFDIKEFSDEAEITLFSTSFDENWNVVALPVANAEITIDGEKTGIFTDTDGKATIKADGNRIISAVCGTQNITPPICVSVSDTPKTGDTGIITAFTVLLSLVLTIVIIKAKKVK